MSSRPEKKSVRKHAPRKPRQSGCIANVETLEERRLLALVYPTTSATPVSIQMWQGTYVVTVRYDSSLKVRRSTLDDRDISIAFPGGYTRSAKLSSVNLTTDSTRLIARYKISAPGGVWDAADNGTYQVFVNKGQVRDTQNNPTRLKQIGAFSVAIPVYPTDYSNGGLLPKRAVSVLNFGAVANDGIDDTDAIQAAIDSLPKSNGTPGASGSIGGVVLIPAGEFTLSRALNLSSCVVLHGEGNQSILRSISTDSNSAAIRIYSAFAEVPTVAATQIQNLKLITDRAAGIVGTADLVDLRLDKLTISSGGIAIDLHGHDVYQATFNDITVENPGAAALYLDVGHHNSAINRISGFTIKGTARSGFNSSRALIDVTADATLGDITIHDIGASVLPFAARGFIGSVRNISILTTADHLFNARLMLLDGSAMQFDKIDGLGGGRRLTLTNSPEVSVAKLGIAAGSTVGASLSIDNTSHLTAAEVYSPNGLGSISRSLFAHRKLYYSSVSAVPLNLSTVSRNLAPASTRVVYITDFGALPNDGIDDSAGIQAAIDSLPLGTGIPGSTSEVGGTVVFPIGIFNTSVPIKLPSGVWLQGQGFGTSINNLKTAATGEAVRLVPRAGFNIGAGIVNLAIYTEFCDAIAADPAITNGLIDLRLLNLQLGPGRMGVDLRNVKTYHARFHTILVREPGSTAMWLGDSGGYSSDNEIIGLQLSGMIRDNYEVNTAQVVLLGETRLENSWIELYGARDLPFYASGSITIRGLWNESHPDVLPEDLAMSFVNCYKVDIDKILGVTDTFKLRFRNSTGVTIGYLNAAGHVVPLKDVLDLDSTSRLRIDAVHTIYDAGMLDDPRLSIGGVYNKNSGDYVDTVNVLTGASLIADPNMTNVGSDVLTAPAWLVNMGDSLGAVQGFYVVEQTATGRRLKIVITGNPSNRPVSVIPRLNIPTSAYGKRMLARWRVDGPDGTIGWGERFEYQYSARVTGSLTAGTSPRTIAPDTRFILLLPPTVGTYYISNVGVIVND